MWPVAKSTVCFCVCVLRVEPSAPPHPPVLRQCHIVHGRACLRFCVRLPSDHKDGHRACVNFVCVSVCVFVHFVYVLDVSFDWCTHYGEHPLRNKHSKI